MKRRRGTGEGQATLPRESRRSLSIALTLVLASGLVVGTSATFNASTSNDDNTFATASLTAPQALTASPSGNSIVLSWTAGSFGGGTGFGHQVQERNLGVEPDPRDGAEGPSDECSESDTFTVTVGRTDAATTTLTHSDGSSASVAGSYACYRVDTEYPAAPSTGQWFSQDDNPLAVVMLGHVARAVSIVNGGLPAKIDEHDVVTVTFNQPVNIATGPTNTNNPGGVPSSGTDVCVQASTGTINLGRTGSLNKDCANTHAVKVGRITGILMGGSGRPSYHATYTWSDCPVAGQCRVLTITIGRRYRGSLDVPVTVMTSPSLAPSTSSGVLTSATGGVAICTAANTSTATCRPVPVGTF